MRVLYCIPSMAGGGTERQVAYLVRELVRIGCEVHVALHRGGENLPLLHSSGGTIHQLGPFSNHDPRLLWCLGRTVAAVKPDVCQCWLLQMELVGGLACMAMRTPWIFSERSSEKAYPPTVKNRLRLTIASFADAIVSNSAAGDAYWEVRLKHRVPRFVIPNGLPLDDIAAAPVATPTEAALAHGEALVLSAGRLDSGKNTETVLRALGRLPGATRFRAMLCGSGPNGAHLEALAMELGLSNRVRFVSYAVNLWSLMKRASVFVSLSRFEGSSNVVLEAMACGCPLIVSDTPSHRELLDEQTAVFVGVDDEAATVAGIERIIADPQGAQRRAMAAQARAAEYGIAAVAERYLNLYRHVVSDGAPFFGAGR